MVSEILSGPERRRRWSSEQKAAIISETARPGASVAEIARRHGISRSLLYSWRREATVRGGIASGLPELVPVVITGGAPEPMVTEDRRKPADVRPGRSRSLCRALFA